MENLKILHSPTDESPFLIVFKPAGLPSAPLFEGDSSILTEAAKEFPQILEIHGKKEVEHGLIHRIDTETNGLVLIAATQKSYDTLILSQKEGKFEKWYRAEIDSLPESPEILGGFPPLPDGLCIISPSKSITVESSFRPFGKKGCEVRPVTQNAGRAALKKGGTALYTTQITLDSEHSAICRIKAGYRHQVRCHLSWYGIPVKGDKIYNPNERNSKGTEHEMKFSAFKISFPHPLTGIPLVFQM